MTKRLLMLALIVTATAAATGSRDCNGHATPVSVQHTTNDAVPVELLFEHDGVRVYRFEDELKRHYYVVPISGKAAEAMSEQQEGKTTIPESIPTVAR